MDKSEKLTLTASMLSEFIEGKRKDIASINLLIDRETGTISCEIGVWLEDNPKSRKSKKVRAGMEIFQKLSPERIYFKGIVDAKTKHSGKKKFWQMEGIGEQLTYVKRKMVVHINGKKEVRTFTVYVGMKPQEAEPHYELISIELEGIRPQRYFSNNCYYWKYDVKNSDGTITEVYCSNSNPKLPRFVKYPGHKNFTYL